MLNSHITANIISLFRTLIIMLINDSIIAAVISNVQLYTAVLINNTTACSTLTANQLIDIGYTIKVIIARLAVSRHMTIIQAIYSGGSLVSPLCAIAQPYINLTCMIGTGVINNTLPGRLLGCKADIDAAILIYVRLICTLGAFQSNDVADNIGCHAFSCNKLFISNRAFILVMICIKDVNINGTAIARQSIICFLKALVCFSFIRRSFDFNRITYRTANQVDSCQIISMYTFSSIISIRLHCSTAYSNIHITFYSNA